MKPDGTTPKESGNSVLLNLVLTNSLLRQSVILWGGGGGGGGGGSNGFICYAPLWPLPHFSSPVLLDVGILLDWSGPE